MAGPRRHRKPCVSDPPEWVRGEPNDCLRDVAEEAYTARGLASWYGADRVKACQELLRAGDKALRELSDVSLTSGARAKAGARAARKFWEAKVCARQRTTSSED